MARKATYLTNSNPTSCCGCEACVQICPTKAVFVSTDAEGFLFPQVDNSLCIDCGLCSSVCPIDSGTRVSNPKGKAFAFQLNDELLLKKSSSGGGFISVANSIIDDGGVVYGAAFVGRRVCHIRIDNTDGLFLLMGSKYVQSKLGDTYSDVQKDLKTGLKVLFVGTPCQVAGLKLFLRKSYEGLFTLDLVCHGTPSQKIFDWTISKIEKRLNAKFKSYSFRDKRVGGWSICSTSEYEKDGKSVYLKYSREMEAYFKAFISGHLMRKSCYECRFSSLQRVGDITIADYWGVKKLHPEFVNIDNGMSLLIVNSEKGESIQNHISEGNFCCAVDIYDAAELNKNLIIPTPYREERETAYDLAFENYSDFLNKYSCCPLEERKRLTMANIMYQLRKNKKIYEILRKIKRILK